MHGAQRTIPLPVLLRLEDLVACGHVTFGDGIVVMGSVAGKLPRIDRHGHVSWYPSAIDQYHCRFFRGHGLVVTPTSTSTSTSTTSSSCTLFALWFWWLWSDKQRGEDKVALG
jgi:hypothetical protein